MATAKRLRKRVEIEPRLYEAIRAYGASRAMNVSVALHALVIEGMERKGLSVASILDHTPEDTAHLDHQAIGEQ